MRRTIAVIAFLIVFMVLLNIPFGTNQPFFLLAVTGALFFGLSFIPAHDAEPGDAPQMSPWTSFLTIFYEPVKVFKYLRAYPKWLPAFLIIAFCTSAYNIAFTRRLTPEVIAAAAIDQTVKSGWITAEQAQPVREKQIEAARSPESKIVGPIGQIIMTFVFIVILAGLYLLGVTMFGGRINFWQSLSVVIYASLPVFTIRNLLSLIILYINSPDTIDPIRGQAGLVADNLGVLFSATTHPYLHIIGSFVGVLSIYGLWLTATGLRTTGHKVSKGAAWVITMAMWSIGFILTLIVGALFPDFV